MIFREHVHAKLPPHSCSQGMPRELRSHLPSFQHSESLRQTFPWKNWLTCMYTHNVYGGNIPGEDIYIYAVRRFRCPECKLHVVHLQRHQVNDET